jgi:hypothetical protein
MLTSCDGKAPATSRTDGGIFGDPTEPSQLLKLTVVGGGSMRNPIDMDRKHSLAIVREIGKQLRSTSKEGQVLPPALRVQLERLEQSQDAQRPVVKRRQN